MAKHVGEFFWIVLYGTQSNVSMSLSSVGTVFDEG